jgi:tripartite-type tricarboxylate transporter receptor subunit TctC
MLIYAPYILGVHPSVPARDAAELPAHTRANPERVNFAQSGVGAAGLAAAGESRAIVNGATATLPFAQNGRPRAIAISGARRLTALADVPTFRELGWPAEGSGTWQGVLAPGTTPPAIVARLHRAFAEAMAVPEIIRRVAELGAESRVGGRRASAAGSTRRPRPGAA